MKNTQRMTLAFLTLVAFQFHGADLFAQTPTLQGPVPFIMIVSDTSSSMEFTDKGSRYPRRVLTGVGNENLASLSNILSGELNEWEPSTFMDIDPNNQASGPEAFGACLVWEPSSCGGYQRPSWNADVNQGGGASLNSDWNHQYADGDTGVMRDRFLNYMRGSSTSAVRLHSKDQPRHITVKEVLTGDMILRPQNFAGGPATPITSLDRNNFGPGCWFVPRHRYASGQPDADQQICLNENSFEELPDHTEPTPHFQEVYDGQLTNGLMDSLAGTAIFSVVGFDGYKEDTAWNDTFNNFINDDVGPIPGYLGRQEGQPCTDMNSAVAPCYNLGVSKIVAPKQLDIPSRFLPEVSRFSQVVIRDYGYLREGRNNNWELSPKSSGNENDRNTVLGETFSEDFDTYYDAHDLAKQPIAAATPIAAAMQDIQGFFAAGQDNSDPINDDAFSECRPKHVVLISDGAPSPERGEVNFTFDNNDGNLSAYNTSEAEISDLVNDVNNIIEPPNSGFFPLSSVRVHVVGMNIGDEDALQKLTDMAKAGNTCAGISLGANWHGTPAGGGTYTCPNKVLNPAENGCLIPPTAGNSYTYPLPDGTLETCNYPALILDVNNRDQLQAALSLLFNDIVDGASVSTRTRTVVTNEIQMESTQPAGGQSRIFSGVVTGGSQYWKGILNRQTQLCSTGGVETLALHEDIGNQVEINGAGIASDKRRIFTSLVSEQHYDYTLQAPTLDLGSTTGASIFPSAFRYLKSGGQDEFGSTQLSNILTDTIDTRIAFEASSLGSAIAGTTAHAILNAGTDERARAIIDVFSARVPEKVGSINGGILVGETGRAMGGILNSNPVLVSPPSLDLPIESYRQFKARFADRHTMLYANSMDGVLHAIHNGEREVQVRVPTVGNVAPGIDAPGPANMMREAWAYVPQMFHTQLDSAAGSQAYLMDGTPVVQDVRLCRAQVGSNYSSLCKDSANNGLEPWEQWKTVLVQGAGLAGSGYYAMDITRPGGRTTDGGGTVQLNPPDPVPLWELTPAYERQQVRTGSQRYGSNTAITDLDRGGCLGSLNVFMGSSMMGTSVSEPAIANLLMTYNNPTGLSVTEQRPVVVFGGGATRANSDDCAPTGRAIYVVDLQTGSIIRRFTSYFDKDGAEFAFSTNTDPIQLTGSPALYDGSPGSVATRGFIGGSGGRLFRMDFVDADPLNWRVDLFFDPNGDPDVDAAVSSVFATPPPLGPASFKPSIASTKDKSVIVTYGLGDKGDSVTNDEAQVVIALRDRGSSLLSENGDGTSTLEWVEALEEDEKLMGNPLTFDSATYWASYKLPDGDSCQPGLARIYGVNFEGDGISKSPYGVWSQVPSIVSASDIQRDTSAGIKWWGPSETTLIRGLTLTLGNPCNVGGIGTDNPEYDDDSSRKPQLIAQTSGQEVDSTLKNVNGNNGLNAGDPVVDRLVVDVKLPESKYQPLYWTAISY